MKSYIKILVFFIGTIFSFQMNAQEVVYLWENGAPGFEYLKNEKEQAKDWWVKNIHNPSITVFEAPKELANGTAVLICPGGGHRELVFDAEGKDAAQYFNKLGITAFVLKYRLAREDNSPYDLNIHAKQDAQRAIKTIRYNADKWNINPKKVGMLGFSAGGEVVSMVVYDNGNSDEKSKDSIDKLNGRPDFQMLVYPGPLGLPDVFPEDAPPVFMVVANDDKCCSGPVVKILNGYREVNRPVEAHIYAKGGHAFNMGYRTELKTLSSWPNRLTDWLSDNGYLNK
ncbi:alpha/beta hydrolase [Urechidicola croceus]|uniref:1,4-beta-xylanase n=1 Tax=Urechidicola croceus TaxID=1850246 RepID=A0A1D8P7E7_9FLAO|nr:alpha/beta hydrolase [Urechidicola croceus]AOW20482.1 1,4-beta-xylanase [Urechidicola croceus]